MAGLGASARADERMSDDPMNEKKAEIIERANAVQHWLDVLRLNLRFEAGCLPPMKAHAVAGLDDLIENAEDELEVLVRIAESLPNA